MKLTKSDKEYLKDIGYAVRDFEQIENGVNGIITEKGNADEIIKEQETWNTC